LDPTCQQYGIITKWHGETNEEMVLGWHALAFFCIMEMEFPFTTPQKKNDLRAPIYLKMFLKYLQYWIISKMRICHPRVTSKEKDWIVQKANLDSSIDRATISFELERMVK